MSNSSSPGLLRYWGSHFKNPRQPEKFLAELRPLVARGWRCTLVLERTPAEGSWLDGLRAAGVTVALQRRPRSRLDLASLRGAYRLCRQINPTLMVCDNIHLVPLLAAFSARVPVRVWWKRAMSSWFEEIREPTWKEQLAPSVRLSCRLARRVFVVSEAVRRELEGLGVPGHKITVRGNPCRLGAQARGILRSPSRLSWGFSEDHVVLIAVGHAVPVKGWDLLLRAFADVVLEQPTARLLLVGSCEATFERSFFHGLQDFVAARGLAGKVTFAGHVQDVRQPLAAADVFVLPSRSEGCANALIEALEVGLPCITTRVGNAVELVQDGRNGLLVDRGDVAALTEAVRRTVRDRDLRFLLARDACLPETVLSLDDYARQLACDYEKLAASVR